MNDRSLHPLAATQASVALTVASEWRYALAVLGMILLTILVLYRDTAMDMVLIWMRSGTFTHGFLIPPITLWLIWRIRDTLARMTPRPNLRVLLGVVAAGFIWLLAELATVGVLSQFALITMLVFAVAAVLGLPLARRMAFPLGFLYFAVPFGEFALPQLMEWTANFTVFALRFSGIPVYREGLQFVIPTGSWSVVEACSGVRYLIASLSVGTLFAYLNYRSLRRRLVFVAVSFVVPVIANWMRAYMIVMVGHVSGNKLAVGVDHLIYGWVFFGIVIMAMFWIGSRWSEDGPPATRKMSATTQAAPVVGRSIVLVAGFLVIVLAAIWPLAQWQIERSLPPRVEQVEPLGSIAGWPVLSEQFVDWSPRFENSSAGLQSTFGEEGRKVGLFLRYYRNQDDRHKMVSSSNVLVATGDPLWAKVAGGSRRITLDRQPVALRTTELRSADSRRMVAWQWYWVNGLLTASDYQAKAYTAFSRLIGRGDDSAVIVVYAPKEQAGGGETTLEDFVTAAGPEIQSVLRRTRDKR